MIFAWSLFVLLLSKISTATITVEIVTLGVSYPTTVGSLCYNIGGVISGVDYLRSAYKGIFEVKNTLLVEPALLTPQMLDVECANIIARWYYRRNMTADITAFISPCK